MAIMLGVSQNAYNKLENGRVPVTMDRFFKIAELLDTPIEEFLTIKKKESGI
jgi:transcriptional regulator with XRE-family HTH domain